MLVVLPAQIISASELFSRLGSMTIVDARDREFEAGYIPGSQSMKWKDWTPIKPDWLSCILGQAKFWGKVPNDLQRVEKNLGALGLSSDQVIVVVGEPHGWGEEGRIAWELMYFGAKKMSLLNGGFSTWMKAGFAIEKGRTPKPSVREFKVTCDEARRASLEQVKAAVYARGVDLLDVRSLEEFNGKKMVPQKRGGIFQARASRRLKAFIRVTDCI